MDAVLFNREIVVDTRLIFFMLCLQGNLILSDIGLAEKRIYHAALNGK